jgi:hypothetical protein
MVLAMETGILTTWQMMLWLKVMKTLLMMLVKDLGLNRLVLTS